MELERFGREGGNIKGTGDGLVIARQPAECMDGKVGAGPLVEKDVPLWWRSHWQNPMIPQHNPSHE